MAEHQIDNLPVFNDNNNNSGDSDSNDEDIIPNKKKRIIEHWVFDREFDTVAEMNTYMEDSIWKLSSG